MNVMRKIKQLSPGVKASIAFLLSNLVTKGIAYITTPIYTRLLSTEEFGQSSVFFTWVAILGIIAMFSLRNGVFNNGMSDFPDKRDEYSFSMVILSNVITVASFIIVSILFPFIKSFINLDYKYILLMFVVFLVEPAFDFWSTRQRYELKYKALSVWTIVCAILSPAIAIVSILLCQDHLVARLFGAEIPLIVIYFLFYLFIGRKVSFKINTQYWKMAVLFNLPLIPHYLSTYLLNSSDKLMISYLVNDTATAFYSVAYAVAAIGTVVWAAINGSLVPYTYEKCKTKDYESISKVATPLLGLFALVSITVMLLAPEVVKIMATSEYMESIYVIPPIVGGVFFQIQYYLYANIVFYYKKTRYIMYASILSTLVNIGLNYIFIGKYGYLAAGYTTLVCYILQAILDFFAMRKVAGSQVYNMKLIMIISGLLIIIALLCNLIYPFKIVRYTIIIIIASGCLVFRKKLKQLFITIRSK